MGLVPRFPRPTETYDPRAQADILNQIETTMTRLDAAINDVRVRPRVRDIAISFNEQGQALVNIRCNDDALSLRYAVAADDTLTLADVQAAPVVAGASHDVTLEGPFSVGATLFVSVLPYSGPAGDGREGTRATNSATRGDPFYAECRAVVIAETETTVTVDAIAVTRGGLATVELEDADGLTFTGPAVGVVGATPQRWVFTKPAVGEGQPRFRAHFPDAPDDSDVAVVPAVGVGPFALLAVRARIIDTRDDRLLVRVATADPFPQGANTARLSWTTTGVTGITPTSPQDVTPTSVFSAVADSYVDLDVPRPAVGAADGEVLFRLRSLAGARTDDYDILFVPARTRVVPTLEVTRTLTATEATIAWDGDPLVELSTDGGTTWGTPPASPFTVERPPAVLEADLTYTFRATGSDNGVPLVISQSVVIPRVGPTYAQGITVTTLSAPGDGGGSFEVDWTRTVSDPSSLTYEIEYTITDGGTGTSFVENVLVEATTKPFTVSTPLGDDGGSSPIGGRVILRAYFGDTLLEQDEYDGLFAI